MAIKQMVDIPTFVGINNVIVKTCDPIFFGYTDNEKLRLLQKSSKNKL